jgi:hypothetical protein
MTDMLPPPGQPDLPGPDLPGQVRAITRRGMIGTTLATALAAPAFAQSAAPAAAPAATDGSTSAVIDVNRARTAPIPIAIPAFAGGTSAGDLVGVISNDLNNCGLFRIVDGSGVAATAPGGAPDFGAWKGTGAQALVTGSITQNGDQLPPIRRARPTGAASPISSPMSSISGCWARRAISTPESPISRPSARPTTRPNASPSWIRTAPTTAS